MPSRRLDAEERALWRRVTADVTPLAGVEAAPPPVIPERSPLPAYREPAGRAVAPPPGPLPARPAMAAIATMRAPPDTLDGGWERRLRRGIVAPERAIDLHGHGLAAAHAALETAIARALADEVRVLLVVTGRPPREGEARRGLIRASVPDWLAASPHTARIAAVRAAHPRHGGAGALYLILRRRRG